MKKSLIALAVAGAVSAPAFAATSNVDIYGIMNIAIEDINHTPTGAAGANQKYTPAVVSNTSRWGFKGTEDLGGGLKAVWQIESKLDNNGTTIGGTTVGDRNTFIGLAGDFGTVVMGKHDTPYKLGTGSLDIFGDTIGDYNLGRADGVELLMNAHDARVGNALAYISPTWSGFHFAAAVVMANDPGVGVGANDTIDATSITGVYANGPLFGSLSYQNVKDVVAAGADSDAIKLGLGYTFGDAKVGFIYEKVNADTKAKDRKSYILNGAYTMGPIVLKAQYGKVNDSQFSAANDDQKMWALGADYNLSKRTTVYFVYASADSDITSAATLVGATNTSGSNGWNLGMKHSF